MPVLSADSEFLVKALPRTLTESPNGMNRRTMLASQTPAQKFLAQLRKMDATGAAGFEGFVRDCLEETLGTRFRLMKSGHQDGADIRSDAPSNLLQVALEGKRYGNATPLPTEELQRKIVSAAESSPALDLWVLVTTRSISSTDREKLNETGARHGIATAVLDVADSGGLPSALNLLAANAPVAIGRHFAGATDIAAWLETIRDANGFAARLGRVLEPFKRQDVGYAAARSASAAWLVEAMSDEATARARLDSFAGLEVEGAIVIPRAAVEQQLDAWLESGPAAPLGLLGDEGVGKTWSFLGWWRRRMDEAPDQLPLTLIVPASAIAGVGNVGGPDLIARLLNERIPIRNEEFWRRRLALWALEPSATPRILLVIDGLNQQPEFLKWQQIIQPLFDSDWQGLFTAAVTCRTSWWNGDLKALATVVPSFQAIQVPIFDEAELDEILGRFKLERSEFSPEMQAILAIPRYCQLAIRRREELADSGDITVERLIYEDWRHRIARVGADLAPTEDEFRAFITEQGTALRSALDDGPEPELTRREMIEALDRDSGRGEPALRTALSEIIDGNWMRRDPGSSRFKLNPSHVPFALALALHEQLRLAGPAKAPDCLATFMDPLRGTDRGTAILRNAFTIALLDTASPDWVFELLLDAWFNQQNFGQVDATVLGQLAPAAPERFLSFAERLWSGDRQHIRDDSVLISPLVTAARAPGFRQTLRRVLTSWLGRIELHPGNLPRPDRADPKVLEMFANAVEASAAVWEGARGQLASIDGIADVTVARHEGDGNPARVAIFAAGILSSLPRAEFISCYVAWAVSRTIAQDHGDSAIEWVLRVNNVDPADGTALVLGAATTLAASGNPVVSAAGTRLLDALATPAAGEIAFSLSVIPYEVRPVHGVATSDEGEVALLEDTTEKALGDYGLLKDEALNPDRTLAPAELSRMRRSAEQFDITDLWASGRQRSRTDVDFDLAEVALARWAPDMLVSIVRRAFDSAPNRMIPSTEPGADSPETRVSGLVMALQEYWPVLGQQQMAALQPVVAQFFPQLFEEGAPTGDWLRLQIPRLAGRSSAEQIELLASDPKGPNFYENDIGVFAALDQADFARLAELIAGEWGVSWLGYLFFADHRAMPGDYEPLYPHLASEDVEARKRVQWLFRYQHSPERYRHLVESGWRWNEHMDRDEGSTGSLNLFHASKIMPVPDLENRVDPELWSGMLADHPDDDEALERYTRYLEAGIRGHRFPGGFGNHHWLNQTDAVRIAAARNTERLVAAINELIASDPHHAFGFDSFPVVDVVTALCTAAPAEGARLWDALWESYLGSSWTLPHFEQIPIVATDPIFLPLRQRVLDAALFDAKVETVVTSALGNGHQAWLLARMDDLLAGPTAGGIAKGLTIARFLDPSEEADAAWRRIEAMSLSNWLAKIRARARTEYALGRTAKAAAQRFKAGRDTGELLADLVLFNHAADTHDFSLLKDWMDDDGFGDLSLVARSFWLEWSEKLKAAAKKNSDGRDKRYLYDEPPKLTHRPWRS